MNISSIVQDHVADDEWIRIRSTRIVNVRRCRTGIPCVAAAAEHPSSSSSSSSSRQRTPCHPPSSEARTTMHRDRLLHLLDEALGISAIGNQNGGTSSQVITNNRARV